MSSNRTCEATLHVEKFVPQHKNDTNLLELKTVMQLIEWSFYCHVTNAMMD